MPYNIKEMIVEAVNQYMNNKDKNEKNREFKQEKNQISSNSIVYDDLPFDENDMQAITDTIAMFKGN